MQRLILVISIIFFSSTSICLAQKAYDKINYRGKLNGHEVNLSLANGYVVASKIELSTGCGKTIGFEATNNVSAQKSLQFSVISKQKDLAKNYFILYGIRENFENIPSQIFGTYNTSSKQFTIIFKKEK